MTTAMTSVSTMTSTSLTASMVSFNSISSELFENKFVFKSIVNYNLWKNHLTDECKNNLLEKYLPSTLNSSEKEETIKHLLNNELNFFDKKILDNIYFQLKIQRQSPELIKLMDELKQLKLQAIKFDEQQRQCALFKEVLNKRKKLFNLAVISPYDGLKTDQVNSNMKNKNKLQFNNRYRNQQLRLRFFRELKDAGIDVDEKDEIEYDDEDDDCVEQFEQRKIKIEKPVTDDDDEEEDEDNDDETDVDTDENHESSNLSSSLKSYNKRLENIEDKTNARENSLKSSINEKQFYKSSTNTKVIRTLLNEQITEQRYLQMLRRHKRKRKRQSLSNFNDPLLNTSNISINGILNRIGIDEEKELLERITMKHQTIKTISSSNINISSKKSSHLNSSSTNVTWSSFQNASSNAVSLTNFIPSKKKLKNVQKIEKPSMKIELNNDDHTNTKVELKNEIKKEPLDVFDFDNDSHPVFSFPKLFSPSSSSALSSGIQHFNTLPTSSNLTTNPPPSSSVTLSATSSQLSGNRSSSSTSSTLETAVANSITTIASTLPPPRALPPPPPPLPPPLPPMLSTSQVRYDDAPICFFSLLREVFKANSPNDRKLTLHKLEELVKEKLRNFDPKLNWSHEMVQSGMNYLSGVLPPPEMVPLVDYKEKNQQWQWIGNGRDSDEVLKNLCDEWTTEKDKNNSTSLMDPSQPIPPPICPTSWTVKRSNEDEKKLYREQEALRYNNPNKAFTFRLHSYSSVVGPVKGCGIGISSSHSSSPNKAREHSLLVNDRPPFVTLLSLVRDAAARLPNGEGTRADICELLKDSQYLLNTVSDQQVNGIVSGALDRLHYEKDPCVKYDVNRKVWIYLHRNRSEEEFERLHEVQVAAAKAKRTLNKSQRKSNSSNKASRKIGPKILRTSSAPTTISEVSNSSSSCSSLPSFSICSSISSIASTTTTSSSIQTLASNETPNIAKILITKDPVLSSSSAVYIASPTPPTTSHLTTTRLPSISTSINTCPTITSVINNISIPTSSISTITSAITKPKIQNKMQQTTIPIDDLAKISTLLPVSPKKKTVQQQQLQKGKSVIITDEKLTEPLTNVTSTATRTVVTSLPLRPITKPETSAITSGVTSILTNKAILSRGTKPAVISKQPYKPTLKQPENINTNNVSATKTIATTHLNLSTGNLPVLATKSSINVPIQQQQQPQTIQTQIQQNITLPKHVQIQSQPISTTSGPVTTSHQITIPTSMLFSARPGSVVLATPNGKSYMMAAAGGSIVLQPQNVTTSLTTATTTTNVVSTVNNQTPLAVRTLQGIRVIPVTCTGQRPQTPIIAQSSTANQTGASSLPHHVVARIITTGQPGRSGLPQTQIVIPSSSSLQPLLLAQTSQLTSPTTTFMTTSSNLSLNSLITTSSSSSSSPITTVTTATTENPLMVVVTNALTPTTTKTVPQSIQNSLAITQSSSTHANENKHL